MSEEKRYSYVAILSRAISIQLKVAPWYSAIAILAEIIMAFMLAGKVMATQSLFDAITNASAGHATFMDCFTPLLVLAGFTFGNQIANGVVNFHNNAMTEKSAGKIKELLYNKLQTIDPACYEDTGFLDEMNKAKAGAHAISPFGMKIFVMVCLYGVYFILIGAYLFRLQSELLIILLIAFVPAMLAQVMRARAFAKVEDQCAPIRRESEYYQKILCDREYVKETRMLGAFRFFFHLFDDSLQLLTQEQWRVERNTTLVQLLLNFSTFAGMAIASYMLFDATMIGAITIGTFVAVFQALNEVFNMMWQIVSHHIGNMNRDVGKVTNYIRMLDMPERTGSSGTPDFAKGVEATNVYFTYPGRDTPAVKELSLAIKAGEIVAIVGENGAGKSTLVRLLTGIYRPFQGQVTIGGLNTAITTPTSLYSDTSAVFQKYQRYKMTMGDNVMISDTKTEKDVDRVRRMLNEAGVEQTQYGMDTMLSPEFNGVDLSGGQWQRLAIARGLYRENSFIVLDEPTAAIDPIEETRIYTQFQHLAKGKCAIIVTHRLGSVRLAHRIIVMAEGEIVDTGTHEELLTRSGKYAEMWAAQAQWYQREGFVRPS